MLITTTPSVDGKRITRCCGVVAGEAILGANLIRDVFASVTDIFGGRSGAYEQELAKARETALAEMEKAAADRGATAVVGVDLDYEVINSMLMVTASGTAVRLGGEIIRDQPARKRKKCWKSAICTSNSKPRTSPS
jgi:uncharacterized protein YbjQ (UPF0145 family)